MLTSDLLRVRRKGERLEPRYLRGKVRQRLLQVSEELVVALAGNMGKQRTAVDEALDAVAHKSTDRIVVNGLRKLLLDRCTFALAEGADPIELRRALFRSAAKIRRDLGAGEKFDRSSVIETAAGDLGLSGASIEERMFADLRASEQLLELRPITPEVLLERYDVALAQGVLLRATRVMLALDGESPGNVRQLFRAARFHGLLHRVERHGDEQWYVELDGPMSLFSAVNKYGLKLAMFLPAVLRCKRWHLRAEVLWGKRKDRAMFELGPQENLVPHDKRVTGVAPEIDKFVAGFRKLDCAWRVQVNDVIIALPGEAVCVPDLSFTNAETGEEVFLEAFGFWSRGAVWQRIETLERGFPSRIILAVGKHLRVSEELLDEDDAGQLYVYKQTMRPKAILQRLDAQS